MSGAGQSRCALLRMNLAARVIEPPRGYRQAIGRRQHAVMVIGLPGSGHRQAAVVRRQNLAAAVLQAGGVQRHGAVGRNQPALIIGMLPHVQRHRALSVLHQLSGAVRQRSGVDADMICRDGGAIQRQVFTAQGQRAEGGHAAVAALQRGGGNRQRSASGVRDLPVAVIQRSGLKGEIGGVDGDCPSPVIDAVLMVQRQSLGTALDKLSLLIIKPSGSHGQLIGSQPSGSIIQRSGGSGDQRAVGNHLRRSGVKSSLFRVESDIFRLRLAARSVQPLPRCVEVSAGQVQAVHLKLACGHQRQFSAVAHASIALRARCQGAFTAADQSRAGKRNVMARGNRAAVLQLAGGRHRDVSRRPYAAAVADISGALHRQFLLTEHSAAAGYAGGRAQL